MKEELKKIQKYAVGLASEEQKEAFAMIDRFMEEGTEAAALQATQLGKQASSFL